VSEIAEKHAMPSEFSHAAASSIAGSHDDIETISLELGEHLGQDSLVMLEVGIHDGEERRRALLAGVELMNYQFNAHGVELGQRYRGGAIASSESFPEYQRDPELYFQPDSVPGSHIPHVWLQHKGAAISTLDVCDYSGFTLIVGVGGGSWLEAAATIATELGVPIKTAQIGLRQDFDDSDGEWIKIREVSDRGCLLVRPDRFIAWRSYDLPIDPAATLREAMLSVLGRGGAK